MLQNEVRSVGSKTVLMFLRSAISSRVRESPFLRDRTESVSQSIAPKNFRVWRSASVNP
jgi:hypothetical protein